MRSTLRNFCKLGLTPARSSDPKKKKGRRATATTETKAKRQRRDREETEKRQRSDREVTEKWQRRDREETEKRQRRDREETEKRQRRDREETEKRQRRDREETEKRQRRDREETEKRQRRCGRPSRISLSSAFSARVPRDHPEETEKRQIQRQISVNSAQHLRRVQTPTRKKRKVRSTLHNFFEAPPCTCSKFRPTQKKRKVRSTLRNFCQLGLAPARSSLVFFSPCPAQAQIKKKKRPASPSINWSQQYLSLSPHFLSAPPGTCSRFRPEKKEKCGRPSAISVNSAWHLPEVLWFFFRLALRKHRKKKKTEASNPYLSLSLSPQSL